MLQEKIKKLRKQRGLSQYELAEKLGIHGGHISRLENGKFKPSIELLKKLTEIFEVSADYLIGNSSECGEVHIQDEALAERIRLLNTIDGKDRDTIIHIIDSILTKRKMVELVAKEISV